ncbi:hypothetical protein P9112_012038 [Eukaryota sp. TZLM1-RC]
MKLVPSFLLCCKCSRDRADDDDDDDDADLEHPELSAYSSQALTEPTTPISNVVCDDQSAFDSTGSTPFYPVRITPPYEPRSLPIGRFRTSSFTEHSVSMTVNQYKMESLLQRGNSGRDTRVYLSRSKVDDSLYVIKVFNSSIIKKKQFSQRSSPIKQGFDRVQTEIAIMKQLRHPNIVSLIEVIDDPSSNKLFLVMEYVSEGAVMPDDVKLMKPLEALDSWIFFRDLVMGVDYLHQQSIVHRDIKPANCLISIDKQRENLKRLKIADFGLSVLIEGDGTLIRSESSSVQDCTSPAFSSPEIVAGGDSWSGKASDIWAMGVTLYSFAFGKLPFYHANMLRLFQLIATSEPEFPEQVDPLLKDLISRMLIKDPSFRITIDEILDHPWLTEGGEYPLPRLKYDPVSLDATDIEAALKEMYIHLDTESMSRRVSVVVHNSITHSRRSSLVPRSISDPSKCGEHRFSNDLSALSHTSDSSILNVNIPDCFIQPDTIAEVDTPTHSTNSAMLFQPSAESESIGVQFITSDGYDDYSTSNYSACMYSSEEGY